MMFDRNQGRTALAVLAALGIAGSVAGQSLIGVDRQVIPITEEAWPCHLEVDVAPFSDRGGRYDLQSVELQLVTRLQADLAAENDAVDPAPNFMAYEHGFVVARLEGITAFRMFTRMYHTPGVAGTDGIPGSGPDYWDFGTVITEPAAATTHVTEIPEALTGELPCKADVVIDGVFDISGTPLATVYLDHSTFDAELVVTYQYDMTCAADVDGGGDVGLTDLLQVLAEWHACGETPADVDGDGCVGFSDLLIVLDAWGVPCVDD